MQNLQKLTLSFSSLSLGFTIPRKPIVNVHDPFSSTVPPNPYSCPYSKPCNSNKALAQSRSIVLIGRAGSLDSSRRRVSRVPQKRNGSLRNRFSHLWPRSCSPPGDTCNIIKLTGNPVREKEPCQGNGSIQGISSFAQDKDGSLRTGSSIATTGTFVKFMVPPDPDELGSLKSSRCQY